MEQPQKYPLLFRRPILSDWAFRLYVMIHIVLSLFLILRNQQIDTSQISPGQAAFDLIATTNHVMTWSAKVTVSLAALGKTCPALWMVFFGA